MRPKLKKPEPSKCIEEVEHRSVPAWFYVGAAVVPVVIAYAICYAFYIIVS